MAHLDPNRPLVPDFVIGGAPKAGTSALYAHLRAHPSVFLTVPKEPQFYTSARLGRKVRGYHLSRSEYAGLFEGRGPGQVAGEASTSYLRNGAAVAPDLFADNPAARLVFILRDPSERAYSDYWFRIHRGSLPLGVPFSDYVRRDDHWLFRASHYWRGLQPFVETFGRGAVLVLLTEDLQGDRAAALASVCRHIGVDPGFRFPDLPRVNATRYPRWPRLLQTLGKVLPGLSRGSVQRPLVGALRSRLLFSERAPKPPMDPRDRAHLIERYADGVRRLEEYLGRDLSHWLRVERAA